MDADLHRLETLLAAASAPSGSVGAVPPLRLDELQGLCVALAMGPDARVPDSWVDFAMGQSASEATPAELLLLLQQFRTSTEVALNDGSLAIRSRTMRTGRVDYAGWCKGFLAGVEISPTRWFDAADAEELSDLLFPVEVLADALPRQDRAAYKPDQWRRLVRNAQDELPAAVRRLAAYWTIVRAPPVTIRREGPKVGRNDPCPCGSGRKLKQCHGV